MSNILLSSRSRFLLIVSVIFTLSVQSSVNAEMLRLKSGEVVVGRIVEHDNERVKIDTGIGIAVTYYLDEIDLIDGETVAEYKAKELEANRMPEGESIVIMEPIEMLTPSEAIEVIKDIVQPKKRKPTAKTIVDIAVVEGEERSSPFGPTIRENETNSDVRDYKVREALTERYELLADEYTGKYENFIKETLEKIQKTQQLIENIHPKVRQDIIRIFLPVMGIIYVLACFPLMKIAQKLECKHRWLIWIPIVQIYYFIYMAEKSPWWSLLFLWPVVNLVIPLVLFSYIVRRLNESSWMTFLMFIPVLNIFLLWYLAYKKPKVRKPIRSFNPSTL